MSDGKTTIADVAKQQNVDVDTVIDAMVERRQGAHQRHRQQAVAEVRRRARASAAPAVRAGAPGREAPGIGGGGLGRIGAVALDSVAKALGITTDELKTDLAKGQSIADIAKAKNVYVDKVIDTLVGDASAKIDQAVKDEHLTQAQADKLKSMLKTVITKFVNNGFPKGMHGGAGFGFGSVHRDSVARCRAFPTGRTSTNDAHLVAADLVVRLRLGA